MPVVWLIFLVACAPKRIESAACDHPYMPTNEGTSWTYSDSYAQAPGPGKEWTRVVTRVEPRRAVELTRTWSNGSRAPDVQRWECRPEGLAWLLSPAAGAAVKEVRAVSLDGVTLPVGLVPGMTWSSVLTVEATIGNRHGVGVTSFTSTSGPIETITVPAGAFDAIPITVRAVHERTFPGKAPERGYDVERVWYVAGVGMVRRAYGPGGGHGPDLGEIGPADPFEEHAVTELVRFTEDRRR